MPATQQQNIGPLSSRVPGTDASIKLPSTYKYLAIAVKMKVAGVGEITRSGANKWSDYITSVQLRADGDTEIDITPQIHDAFMDTIGFADDPNVMVIPLAMPHARLGAGEDLSGYGTADVGSLDLIVKLKTGAHVIDELELYAMVTVNEPLGQHLRIRRHPRVIAGAGEFEVNDIFQVGELIYGFALDNNAFDKVVFKEGSRIVHESVKDVQTAFGSLVGRSNDGRFIDLMMRDRVEEIHLVTPADHRLTLTYTAAANVDYAVFSLTAPSQS